MAKAKKAPKKTAKATKKPTKAVAATKTRKVTKEPAATQPVSKVAKKAAKTRTKSEIFHILAETSGLPKKSVSTVFHNLTELIAMDVSSGPGVFTVPGLMKIVKIKKPATKARKGVNPFTGEEMTFKAKPARSAVKVRPLKGLKEMVS